METKPGREELSPDRSLRFSAQTAALAQAGLVYDGFISYHHDGRQAAIAHALQYALHRFAKPWYRLRAIRLYRDETNLGARPDLWAAIKADLDRSRFLLLMASPESAASRWVEEETAHWLKMKGQDTLLIVVTGGAIAWDTTHQCFDPLATTALPPAVLTAVSCEPFWIDLTWVGDPSGDLGIENPRFHDAVATLAATLRGTDKDSLSGEDRMQRRRAMRLAYGALAIIGLLAIAASIAAIGFFFMQREAGKQRDQAQEALLQSAARETVLRTRDGRPEEAWDSLRASVELARPQLESGRLPARVSEAGLQALIENRTGPRLSLELGAASRAAATDLESDDPQPGSFSPDGSRVAAGSFYEFGVWRSDDGRREQVLRLPHAVANVFFHESGRVVFVAGPISGTEAIGEHYALTALDLVTKRWRTYAIATCHNAFPCISAEKRPGRRSIDIRRMARPERLADPEPRVARTDNLLVPTDRYAGRSQGRFHIALTEPTKSLVVFDETAQKFAAVGSPGNVAAVARDVPLVLVGSGASNILTLYRIELSAGNGVVLRRWKEFHAERSMGTKDLGLAPDGKTLFYSNNRWGTGGGNGTALTAAVDVQTGRSLWKTAFEGKTVYSPDGALIAQSDHLTNVVSAQTSGRLLSLSGFATAFSTDSSMLLTEVRDKRWSPPTDKSVWRLAEVVPIPSLSRTDELPPSLRSKCPDDPSLFRVMADRTNRRWNDHDWRRIDDIAPARIGAAEATPPNLSVHRFEWKGNLIEVYDNSAAAEGPTASGTPAEIVARFPEARGKLRKGFDVTLSSQTSLDGKWVSSVVAYQGDKIDRRWISWTVAATRAGGGKIVASGEMHEKDSNSSGVSEFTDIGVSFLSPIPAFAVQRDECTMDLYALPVGKKLGSVALAFSHAVWARPVSADVVALFSSDWYGNSSSVQLISVPMLAQGPWLLFASTHEEEAAKPDGLFKSGPGRGPLFPFPCVGLMSFIEDGRYMVVRAENCEGLPVDAGSVVLEIPPWGHRLDRLLFP